MKALAFVLMLAGCRCEGHWSTGPLPAQECQSVHRGSYDVDECHYVDAPEPHPLIPPSHSPVGDWMEWRNGGLTPGWNGFGF